MTEEKNYFSCGYCIYSQLMDPPKGSNRRQKRGYCIFEPPAVFPMPQPKKTSLAAAGRQPEMEVIPLMMRPVVEENEPMCGRGVLNAEAMKGLGIENKAGCGGCNDEGAKCECK